MGIKAKRVGVGAGACAGIGAGLLSAVNGHWWDAVVTAVAFGFLAMGAALAVVWVCLLVRDHRRNTTGQKPSLVARLRPLRPQWPMYSKETRDAILADTRITAQGEALKQIAAAQLEVVRVQTLSDATIEANQERSRQIINDQGEIIDSLRKQILSKTLAFEARDEEARRLFQQLRYGCVLLPERVIASQQYEAMRVALQGLKPSLERLRETTDATWSAMLKIAEGVSPNSALGWLLTCFRRFPSKFSVSSVRAFLEHVDSSDRDPRPYLVAAYVKYRDWRAWHVRLMGLLGRSPQDSAGYGEWRAAEIAFFAKLEERLGIPLLAEVQMSIREYDSQHGAVADLLPKVTVIPEVGGAFDWKPLVLEVSENELARDAAFGVALKRIREADGPSDLNSAGPAST
ncbi:MAG: hypothetical protein ACREPM_22655 [Gemmatimonadaceae bacterium]